MMKRFLKWMALVVFCAALLCALAWLGRGGWRYYKVGKMLNASAETMARANVMPAKKKPGTTAGNIVNLGYAKFDIGKQGGAVTMKVTGEKGTGVAVTCGDYRVEFGAPYPPVTMGDAFRAEVEATTARYPKLAAYMLATCTDEVGACLEREQTHPVTFFPLCRMSDDEFQLYSRKLQEKVKDYGMNEVFSFDTVRTKGVGHIGKTAEDRQNGRLLLSSRDGWKIVACDVTAKEGSAGDVGDLMERIAGTFEFTVENLGDGDEVKRVISEVGKGK